MAIRRIPPVLELGNFLDSFSKIRIAIIIKVLLVILYQKYS